MQSLTRTATVHGNQAVLVSIECLTTSGFAGIQLVGNTSDLCRDAKERAKTVLESLGVRMGHKRILINFSPADCRKEGNHFDLPIAISLAILLAGKETSIDPKDWLFAAELGLDGALRPTQALVPLVLCALQNGLKGVVIAAENAPEMEIFLAIAQLHGRDFQYHCFQDLSGVLLWVFEGQRPDRLQTDAQSPEETEPAALDFDSMYLNPALRRLALCVATGRHSLLLRGSPGCGKSMFAQRLPSLLPRLTPERHLDTLRIHSLVAKGMSSAVLRGTPPFRQPHHSSSPQALLGTAEQPGELSLAHGGILFLDELPEFRRDLLEALREPLETGKVHVSRAQRKASWNSKVQLIAACNPCPCGFDGSKRRLCICSSQQLAHYRSRLSGPLLERIDIHFRMPELKPSHFIETLPQQSCQLIGETAKARAFMHERWGAEHDNAEAGLDAILDSSLIDAATRREFMEILERLEISSRSSLRILRVARTLADLDGTLVMKSSHVQEAAAWRSVR